MTPGLDNETIDKIKGSYFNILAFFLSKDVVKSDHMRCLMRWGLQLNVNQYDVSKAVLDAYAFAQPASKLTRMEAIYHLVYLINQDEIVHDTELEVASIYATQLGFPASVVTDLFKAISTAGDDGISAREWQQEVADFLRVNNL